MEKVYCAICGQAAVNTHHLIYGRGLRQLADEDGLTIPLCFNCHSHIHDDGVLGTMSKMLGQMMYERDKGSRADFIKRYGRSWL
jgi:predicted HNH restriction endonuclease